MLINILLIHFDIIAAYWIPYVAIDADTSSNDIICDAYLYKIPLYRRVSFAMWKYEGNNKACNDLFISYKYFLYHCVF